MLPANRKEDGTANIAAIKRMLDEYRDVTGQDVYAMGRAAISSLLKEGVPEDTAALARLVLDELFPMERILVGIAEEYEKMGKEYDGLKTGKDRARWHSCRRAAREEIMRHWGWHTGAGQVSGDVDIDLTGV